MRFKFSKKGFTRIHLNYAKIGSLSHIHYILACDGHFISTSFKDWDSSSYKRVSHIYLKRWVQVTPVGVTLKSYTFFWPLDLRKPLDLSRSNGKKKTLINANILTSISLIILYLLHSIRISKPNKRIHLTFSLSLSLSLRLVFKPLSLCLSPFAAPPPPLFQVTARRRREKKLH